ncbi:MAG: F0F1 ATP synthase subunit A [Planctomycetota bacterium]|jgi:F-type H+-transporting ATPase subunit a
MISASSKILPARGSAIPARGRALRALLQALTFVVCLGSFGLDRLTAQEPQGSVDHGHAVSTMEMENKDFFEQKYVHLMPHAIGGHDEGGPNAFTFYDVNLFQLIALGLMLVVFGSVLVSFRSASSPWIIRVFRGWCRWIRDEMVVSVMGKEDGTRFAPYFTYLFFFIAFLNLIGLIPGSVTSTACVFVTVALAGLTFAFMVVGGMMQQGVFTFWKNLLPHGLPVALIPLMAVLEVIGLLVKPFALTIRLFANMLAGHLVIYSFIGMIFLFAKLLEMSPVAYGTAAVAVGIGVFISIIEGFVALLQAYIFTFLSIVFVQQSLHPHH